VIQLTLSVVNENESLLGSSWQGNGETKEAGNAGDLVHSSFASLSVSARALPVQAVPTFSTPAPALDTWSRAELNDISRGGLQPSMHWAYSATVLTAGDNVIR
jgi:hypothetical protein